MFLSVWVLEAGGGPSSSLRFKYFFPPLRPVSLPLLPSSAQWGSCDGPGLSRSPGVISPSSGLLTVAPICPQKPSQQCLEECLIGSLGVRIPGDWRSAVRTVGKCISPRSGPQGAAQYGWGE